MWCREERKLIQTHMSAHWKKWSICIVFGVTRTCAVCCYSAITQVLTPVSRLGKPSHTLHPPYRPSLAPSDFHLFRPLKDAFRRRKFESNDDVVRAVRTWLRQQNKEWYPSGIYVVPCWRKAVGLNGEFVESQDTN